MLLLAALFRFTFSYRQLHAASTSAAMALAHALRIQTVQLRNWGQTTRFKLAPVTSGFWQGGSTATAVTCPGAVVRLAQLDKHALQGARLAHIA